jgi:hypothetical protein
MKKYLSYALFVFCILSSAYAGTDGSNELKKKNSGEVKDCFEGINRGIRHLTKF